MKQVKKLENVKDQLFAKKVENFKPTTINGGGGASGTNMTQDTDSSNTLSISDGVFQFN